MPKEAKEIYKNIKKWKNRIKELEEHKKLDIRRAIVFGRRFGLKEEKLNYKWKIIDEEINNLQKLIIEWSEISVESTVSSKTVSYINQAFEDTEEIINNEYKTSSPKM